MTILSRLIVAGVRYDGVLLNNDGSITFATTNVNGPWTPEQIFAVKQTLGLLPPKITPQGLCNSVDAFRDKRLETGYVDVTTAKTYQCDPTSVGRWNAMATQAYISMSNPTPPPTPVTYTIITGDNTVITLTPVQVFDLFAGRVAPWIQQTIFFARAMKDNILAGNPPSDITQGWP